MTSRMKTSHRDKAFGSKHRPKYLWCLHCERTYEQGTWREVRGLQMCPYPECGGDAVLDAWDWDSLRYHYPQYPPVPETGTRYPLYPDESAPGT
jgi:hypothetical protein